jgi:hypothetical protein
MWRPPQQNVLQNVLLVNIQNVQLEKLRNVSISATRTNDRKMRQMSPKIPAPPDPPRPHTLSIRLSDEEKDDLEATQAMLAKFWKREKVERADVLRAALAMLKAELETTEKGAAVGARK